MDGDGRVGRADRRILGRLLRLRRHQRGARRRNSPGRKRQTGLDGPVNLTAPEPVRAREFARAIGRAVGRRAWLPVPTPFVRMGLGVVTDIMVRGQRVIPAWASALGYQFRFPVLGAALQDLLGQPDNDIVAGSTE